MQEAKFLAISGVTELNLIAEDTNQWGQDFGSTDPRRLADLLYKIADIEGIVRIRLLYCYPSYFSDELIEAIASIDKVRLCMRRAVTPHAGIACGQVRCRQLGVDTRFDTRFDKRTSTDAPRPHTPRPALTGPVTPSNNAGVQVRRHSPTAYLGPRAQDHEQTAPRPH